jgi:hypothetical protein
MIIEYAPADGERRCWDLDGQKLMASEAEAVERLSDWTWGEALAQLRRGSIRALRVVAYVMEKRSNPGLRFSEFDPAADELDFWLGETERAEWRARLKEADMDEDSRTAMLDALDHLDEVIAAKTGRSAEEGEELPKDSVAEASRTAA